MIAILKRDLRLALGSGGGFGQGLGFFLIVIFLIALALGPKTQLLIEIAPSIIFVAALLSGLLSLDRMFRVDDDDGTLAQLRLSAVPLPMVVVSKAFVHWLTTGFAMSLLTPLLALAIGMDQSSILALTLSLFIGTPALSLIGAIGAALTLSIKRASLIQALITLPFYIPTLIYGTIAAQSGGKQNAALLILLGLSLLAIVLSPWVTAKTLERHQL